MLETREENKMAKEPGRKCDKCGKVLIDEKGDIRNHPNMMNSSGKIFLCDGCKEYCKVRQERYGIDIEELLKKGEPKTKKKEAEPKTEEPKEERKAPVKNKKGGSKK